MSAILGGLIGLAIGYVTVRLHQWWEWRNVPSQASYYAPMSTELPTMTTCSGGCPDRCTVTDWEDA